MLTEISHAVEFLSRLIPDSARVPPEQRDNWKDALTRLLSQRFQSHWNPECPLAGNAYRAVTTFAGKLDPVLVQAAGEAGLPQSVLSVNVPRDLVLWVDPYSVSYRIRDNSSVFALYEDKSRCRAFGLRSDFSISASSTPVMIRAPHDDRSATSSPLALHSHQQSNGGRHQFVTPRSHAGSLSSARHTPSPPSAGVGAPLGADGSNMGSLAGTMSSSSSSSNSSSPRTPPTLPQQAPPPGLGKGATAYFPLYNNNPYATPTQDGSMPHYMYPQPHPTSHMYC